MNLKQSIFNPESDQHRKIVNRVMEAARKGYTAGRELRDRAKQIDSTLKAFVPTRNLDNYWRLRNHENPEAPLEIVIPISKSARDTFLTYMAAAFLSDPMRIYALRGRGDRAAIARAALLERLLNLQALWFKHDLSYMTFWNDMFCYGIGAVIPEWSKIKRRQTITDFADEAMAMIMSQEGKKVSPGDMIKYSQEKIVAEGNKLTNCGVRNIFLDPDAPLHEQDRGEFCGYIERVNVLSLVEKAKDPEERLDLKACRYLSERVRSGAYGSAGMFFDTALGGDYGYETIHELTFPSEKRETCYVVHLFKRVDPKEWGIAAGDDVPDSVMCEFIVGAGEVLIGVIPIDYDHGMMPMVFASPSHDGYETYPLAELASVYGMQQYCDWKVRAQVANQSKVLNDMLLIDPTAFEEEDLLNPAPGKLIRLKRALYNSGGIDQFIKQLEVRDVTAGNLQDVMQVASFMQELIGVSDIVRGDLSGLPERPTAALGMAARQSALSRLQYMAQKIQSQSMVPLTYMMAYNTLQFMSQEMVINIVGSRYEEDIRAVLNMGPDETDIYLTPADLDGDFDVEPQTKLRNEADVQAMQPVVERLLQIPEIALQIFSKLDASALVLNYIKRSGFENVEDFLAKTGPIAVNPVVMPDQQAAEQARAGNLVPMDSIGGIV